MTLGILHALKGPRNVEELLRTIPDALRRWLAFDRVRLSLNGDLTSKPCWHMLENEGTVPSDVASQDFPSVCAVP